MIFTLILNIFYALISLIVSLLPDADSSWAGGLTDAMNFMGSFIAHIAFVSPLMLQVMVILGLLIILIFGIFTFKILNWVYNKIRGSG